MHVERPCLRESIIYWRRTIFGSARERTVVLAEMHARTLAEEHARCWTTLHDRFVALVHYSCGYAQSWWLDACIEDDDPFDPVALACTINVKLAIG
jgi:hypothetical protein